MHVSRLWSYKAHNRPTRHYDAPSHSPPPHHGSSSNHRSAGGGELPTCRESFLGGRPADCTSLEYDSRLGSPLPPRSLPPQGSEEAPPLDLASMSLSARGNFLGGASFGGMGLSTLGNAALPSPGSLRAGSLLGGGGGYSELDPPRAMSARRPSTISTRSEVELAPPWPHTSCTHRTYTMHVWPKYAPPGARGGAPHLTPTPAPQPWANHPHQVGDALDQYQTELARTTMATRVSGSGSSPTRSPTVSGISGYSSLSRPGRGDADLPRRRP